MVRDHAPDLRVEPVDERAAAIGTRGGGWPDGDVRTMSGGSNRLPDGFSPARCSSRRMDRDDELVHQRVVGVVREKLAEAVFLAARAKESDAGAGGDRVAVGIAADQDDPFAREGTIVSRADTSLPRRPTRISRFSRYGSENTSTFSRSRIFPCRGAAVVNFPLRALSCNSSIVDDGRVGARSDAFQGVVDQIERETWLTGRIQ